jgi:hypothetical protein
MGSFTGSSLILVGASHTLTDIGVDKGVNPKAYPAFKYMCADSSIAMGMLLGLHLYPPLYLLAYGMRQPK